MDLTHFIAGPYCTKLMAGLGADVVKVERPGGDPVRAFGPFASGAATSHASTPPEDGAWHLYLNTGKRSIVLDLKTDGGRLMLLQLAAKADILVENFAPGTMDRMGLGYQMLREANPALVTTYISNFGQTGPHRDWRAAEINLYAMGGLMNITGEPDQEPLKEGMPLAQLGAGQNAFVATMAALMYAEETGEGQQIDVSIAEYATNILENALMQYSYSGQEYTRVGNRGYGRAAWGIYPCRDGHVGIIAGPDHRWPEVARIMEREELADPRFASRRGRQDNADEIDALMLPWLIDHDKVEIFKAGQESGLGFASSRLCRTSWRWSSSWTGTISCGWTIQRQVNSPTPARLSPASPPPRPGCSGEPRSWANTRQRCWLNGQTAVEGLPGARPFPHLGRPILHQADGRSGR